MKLSNKNILIISPEPWDHLFVSKHHYATHLMRRGNKVFFLNPPTKQDRIKSSNYPEIKIIDHKGFPKGLRYYPSVIRRILTQLRFKKIEQISKTNFDIIWSFDNSIFFQMDALPKSILKVSHIVDLNQNFETKLAAKTAHVCFGVIEPIVERLKTYNINTYKVGHGLNISEINDINFKAPGKNKTKAFYLGNLAMSYLDWDNLFATASNNLMIDFVFIGSNGDNFDISKNSTHKSKVEISKLPNVYFLDPIPSSAISATIEKADLLMISYQEKYHEDQSNSHKILEYLYSGKPIVATFTKEYENKELMYMSNRNSEWPSVFEYVINNLSKCSSKDLADKRKKYALDHTYDKQIDRIEKILASLQT